MIDQNLHLYCSRIWLKDLAVRELGMMKERANDQLRCFITQYDQQFFKLPEWPQVLLKE